MGGSRTVAPSPGWYADPTGRAELRFWTGQEWTPWIWDGTAVGADQRPVRRPLDRSDLTHLEFIDRVFLPEARALGIVAPCEDDGLEGLVGQLTTEASGVAIPERTGAAPATRPAPTPQPVWTPPATPASAPVAGGITQKGAPPARAKALQPAPGLDVDQATPAQRGRQSAFGGWWARAREAVGRDLAVHGLAYLGVLLFFVGVFGLVVFAFGDVTPGLRPLAEFLIAVAPFAAGAMLLQRQAVIVGRALEVMGGLLLPIMVATMLLDGVGFPPDPHGIPLVLTLTALIGLITAAYAWWSTKHPGSALRYLVAPLAWLTVAVATLGLGRAIPVGKDVATPAAAQVTATAAALLLTVLWARSHQRATLAGPTLSVAGPGLFLVALLSVLTWKAEGWPTAPVLICGVLVLTALELLHDRLSVIVLGLAEPLWWALVWAALVSGVETAPAGVAAALGFVLLVEVAAAARRPVWALALPAMGAAAALTSTWVAAPWATAAFSAAAVWALGRRMAPYALAGAAVVLDWVAALLPALALAALAEWSDPPTAVAAGAGVVLLATIPAARPLLRRDRDDTFWIIWWRAGGTVVAVASLAVWSDGLSVSQKWLVTLSLISLVIASIFGPIPGVWRPWPVAALSAAAWLTACATVGAADMVRAGALAVAGLVMVGVAHTSRAGLRGKGTTSPTPAGSVGLAGHAVGVVAVLVASYGRWSLVLAMGFATAGWILTTVMDNRDASPVGRALERVSTPFGLLPPGLAAVGLPVTVALALDTAGVLRFADPWAVVVPAVTAVAYAAATRLSLPDRIGATAAWGGFAAGILASALARERLPAVWALGALVVSVAVLRPDRRAPVMTWVAWAGSAPLAGLLVAQWWPWFGALAGETAASATLVSVGGVLLVGGAAFDLRGRPWVPRYTPARPGSLAPVVIGGAELVAGLALAYAVLTREQAGWVTVVAAAAVLATAVLARAGALAGVGTVLGWTAVVLLARQEIDARPWIPVVVALVLLVLAQLLSVVEARAEASPRWWARWDVPLLVSAAPVAGTALAAASGSPHWGATFVAVGLECMAVAVRLRRVLAVSVGVGMVGTALVLLGAGNAGEGWLALALLGLSVALTALATHAHGSARLACQIGGSLAALASWQVAMAWFGWTVQQKADATTLGAGVLAIAAALVARSHRLERSWVWVWGGMAVAVAALVAGYTELILGVGLADAAPSWPAATGLLLVAVALLAGAGPLAQTWLRELGMAFGVVAVLESLQTGHAGTGTQVAVLAVLSAICAVLSLSLFVRQQAETWQRPPVILGVAFALGAIVVAMPSASADDLMLLVPGLAASALQAAAVGVVLRNTAVQMLSPILACASWLVFSSQAMDDNPQWITVPIGLAILTVVELWRQDLRQRGRPVAPPEVVVLEVAGVAFLVGASFVQAVTEALAYALLAAALGLAVMGWGVLTKVRRRLAAGAMIVLASLVVLVAVPLVGLLPAWQGAGLWVLIAGLGLVALLVASFLEQGKVAAHTGLTRFGQVTAGWE